MFDDGYAEVNGQRLHYVTSGNAGAPMMLFIHGAPNFLYYWEDQLAEFGKDHFAVAPDMRGYNLSSRPGEIEQYKLKYLVEDVRQLAGKLSSDRKFILVGHDRDGLICFVFAMYHPELVDKLIVCNAPHPCLIERELTKAPGSSTAAATCSASTDTATPTNRSTPRRSRGTRLSNSSRRAGWPTRWSSGATGG